MNPVTETECALIHQYQRVTQILLEGDPTQEVIDAARGMTFKVNIAAAAAEQKRQRRMARGEQTSAGPEPNPVKVECLIEEDRRKGPTRYHGLAKPGTVEAAEKAPRTRVSSVGAPPDGMSGQRRGATRVPTLRELLRARFDRLRFWS